MPRSAAVRRLPARSAASSTHRLPGAHTRAEHAAIAKASAAWEREVARGLESFIGQTIPLTTREGLHVTHVLNLAEDETFAGWYNWRGITNPDMVLLGVLVGGPDNGAEAAIAVDAKLSARSSKTQVMTETLAQLLEPFQPLSNLVDSLLGKGASDRLVLRSGFHVIRGVATTIGTAAKSTRSLADPEYAAEVAATKPVMLHPLPRSRAARSRAAAPREEPKPTSAPVSAPAAAMTNHAALLTETIWGLDRLQTEGIAMPEPKGVYTMTDVLALDHRPDAPADAVILGTHGAEHVAQAVVLGAKRPMPTDAEVRAFLAALPASFRETDYRIASPFRVVPGKVDTLAVLGNRRTVVLPA